MEHGVRYPDCKGLLVSLYIHVFGLFEREQCTKHSQLRVCVDRLRRGDGVQADGDRLVEIGRFGNDQLESPHEQREKHTGPPPPDLLRVIKHCFGHRQQNVEMPS